jgi:CheY-like chemotaxis protein
MQAYNKVFLLENDTDDWSFFLEALRAVNPAASCTVAESGAQGMDVLKASPQAPDIIFLDLHMPRIGGLEFLTWLKQDKQFQNIPVVVVTSSPNHAERCYEAGANLYVTKTYSFELLRNALAEIFRHDIASDTLLLRELFKQKAKQQQAVLNAAG